MDEFGSAFCGVSKVASRKWINAPAAAVSCFQYCNPPARHREPPCCHQASRARADDNDVLRIKL